MASLKQIEANRNNAKKSTGPTTEEGKALSRGNAVKHAMAGDAGVADEGGEAFVARLESWGRQYRAVGEAAEWALARLVAASFQIERCEAAYNGVVAAHSERARHAWEIDRDAEATALLSRIAARPTLVAAQLETTTQGCALKAHLWCRLAEALEANGAWNEVEEATALDLLGLPADLRHGRTPLDGPQGTDPRVHRRTVIDDEVARLDARAEALAPLDDLQRRQAAAGLTAILSAPARLVLRYERDAWRRYREAIRDLRNPPEPAIDEPQPAAQAPPVAQPAAVEPPRPATTPVPTPVAKATDVVHAAERPRPIAAPTRPIEPVGYAYADFAVGSARGS